VYATVLSLLENQKNKKLIIIVLSSIPAIYTLVFINTFGVNIPHWDEWGLIPFLNSSLNGDSQWFEKLFSQHNEHRIVFPRLIFLINSVLTSWNLIAQMYLSWILIGTSLVALYLLLKKLPQNFVWLIIPISFIMYSPIQVENLLWGQQVQWFFVVSCLFWSLYFLSKDKFIFIVPAIIFSVISSFSLLLGLIIWPIGLLSLFVRSNDKRKSIIIWIGMAILIFVIYFNNLTLSPNRPIILSSSNLNLFIDYVIAFLGSSTPSPISDIRTIISISMMLIVIFGIIIYKIKNKKISLSILPWFQLAAFGFIAALVTGIGRMSFGVEQALSSRYTTISSIFEISSLVFLTFIFITIRNNVKDTNTKKLVTIIFVIIIITGTSATIYDYVLGWDAGKSWFLKRNQGFECFNNILSPSCDILHPNRDRVIDGSNLLLANNLGLFSAQNLENKKDLFFKKINWDNLEDSEGLGNIDTINGKKISEKNSIEISKNTVSISGWLLDENKKSVDMIILFVDENPIAKYEKYVRFPDLDSKSQEEHFHHAIKLYWNNRGDLQSAFPEVKDNDFSNLEKWVLNHEPPILREYVDSAFLPRTDIVNIHGESTELYSGWKFSIISGFFANKCHDFSIVGITNSTKIVIESETQICKIN